MLVNDCHEILNNRVERLHCLLPQDSTFFDTIFVSRAGSTCEECVLDVIRDLVCQNSRRKHKRVRVNDGTLLRVSRHTRSVLPGFQQSIPFLADTCASMAKSLVRYGLASNLNECQRTLRGLIHRLLGPGDGDTNFLSSLPTLPLLLIRCVISSYAPITDALALAEILDPLEQEALKRQHLLLSDKEEATIMMQARTLQLFYSSEDAKHLLISLLRYAYETVTATYRSFNTLKFPTYVMCRGGSEVRMDSATRKEWVKTSMYCEHERLDFMCNVVELISDSVVGAGLAPNEDLPMINNLLEFIRRFSCWMMAAVLNSVVVIYDLDGGEEMLLMGAATLDRFRRHAKLLPADIMCWQQFFEMEVLALLRERNSAYVELNLDVSLARMTDGFASVFDIVSRMPDFWESNAVTEEECTPVLVNPLMPSVIMAHEWSLGMISAAVHTMLCAPEVYFSARSNLSGRGPPSEAEFQEDFRSLLSLLQRTLTGLVECVQRTGCGFFGRITFHAMYRTARRFPVHIGRFESRPLVCSLMQSSAELAQQLLLLLSQRFFLASDLLEALQSSEYVGRGGISSDVQQSNHQGEEEDKRDVIHEAELETDHAAFR